MSMTLDWAEQAARLFEPAAPRKWPTPGAMAMALEPTVGTTPALDLIDVALVDLFDGDDDRLMIFMSPQEGKSEKVSRRLPAWLLSHDPTLRIAIVSFEAKKASRWGGRILRDVAQHPSMGITVSDDGGRAAGRWETAEGGRMICVGIAGGITGEPVDVLIIDDPIRGRAEAESKTYREAAWEWWESNGSTRLSERGKVILMMTRWHTDDLAGRLLEREPGEWRVVSIPAIAVDADDALGREIGEEMPSVRGRKPGFFRKLATLRSAYVFSSIYQQRPTAAEGGLFKRGDWRYWEQADDTLLVNGSAYRLEDCARFITIDLATSTKTSADYTVAAAWAITFTGEIVLLDRVRERVPQIDHAALIEPLRQRWLTRFDVTYIESRMFGSTLVYALGRKGVPIGELHADADKLTRAMAAADLVRQNRVYLPRNAPWLDTWLDEHADFPNVAHDDQVDVMAYAARVAITHWIPQQSAEAERAYTAPAGEVDFMTVNF